MKNSGFENERDFINFFNKHPFIYFSKKWKKHLLRMFPFIKDKDIIKCYRYKLPTCKPDIVIECKGLKQLVSLKTGHNPPVHKEYYKYFYNFLYKLGVSNETLNTISLYQYGLSKKLGIVEKLLTRDEIVERYKDRIIKANEELNKPNIILAVAWRAIIKGANRDNECINYFYYGRMTKGLLISKEQILQSVLMENNISDKYIHIGQLVYQPSGRDRSRPDYKYTRIHWPILSLLFYKALDEDNILLRNDE